MLCNSLNLTADGKVVLERFVVKEDQLDDCEGEDQSGTSDSDSDYEDALTGGERGSDTQSEHTGGTPTNVRSFNGTEVH